MATTLGGPPAANPAPKKKQTPSKLPYAFRQSLEHPDIVTSVAFAGEHCLITGCQDGLARIFHNKDETWELAHTSINAHPLGINMVAWDGAQAFATCGDNFIAALWDLSGNKLAETGKHPDVVMAVGFYRKGKTLFTCCFDGKVRGWDYSGKITHTFDDHTHAAVHCSFHEDLMITASFDGRCLMYDLAKKQKLEKEFPAGATDKKPLSFVKIHHNGKYTLVGHLNANRLTLNTTADCKQARSYDKINFGEYACIGTILGRCCYTGTCTGATHVIQLTTGKAQVLQHHTGPVLQVAAAMNWLADGTCPSDCYTFDENVASIDKKCNVYKRPAA